MKPSGFCREAPKQPHTRGDSWGHH
jgi:hypothetical protein